LHVKSVTIKDIAKVANVSYATVSRALSGSTEIGEETRERILKICRDMGYTATMLRAHVMKETKLLGLIVAISTTRSCPKCVHIEMRARGTRLQPHALQFRRTIESGAQRV
jgi:LacI family transcriptional regulator